MVGISACRPVLCRAAMGAGGAKGPCATERLLHLGQNNHFLMKRFTSAQCIVLSPHTWFICSAVTSIACMCSDGTLFCSCVVVPYGIGFPQVSRFFPWGICFGPSKPVFQFAPPPIPGLCLHDIAMLLPVQKEIGRGLDGTTLGGAGAM